MCKVHRIFIKPMGDKKKLKTLHITLVKHDIRANAWDNTAIYVLCIYSL